MVARRQFSRALQSANAILGSALLVGTEALTAEMLRLQGALQKADQDGAEKIIENARKVLDFYRP